MTEPSKKSISFVAAGSAAGAAFSTTVGGVGIVGGFGGIGLGLGAMSGVGAVAGAAAYGAVEAISSEDGTALGALGLGALGGLGISSTIGGMGLGIGGTAIGLGAGAMAMTGGVIGLGLYGVAKMFTASGNNNRYAQNLYFLEDITREWESEKRWRDLEGLSIEEELEALKAHVSSKTVNENLNAGLPPDESVFSILLSQTADKSRWQCVKKLKGHEKAVNCLAFSADGKTLISGSDDRSIKLWNLNKGDFVYSFYGCRDEIQTLSASDDGKLLIAGGLDGRISAWYLENKAPFVGFFGSAASPSSHNGAVCSLAIQKNRRFIVSGGSDGRVRIWGGVTGELKRTFNEHKGTVWAVAITPDGQSIVTGGADKLIKLWTTESFKSYRTLCGHEGEVTALAITPDGKTLISGAGDKTIKLWDLETGEPIQTLLGHGKTIFSLVVSSNGKILASADRDEIQLWNLESSRLVDTLLGAHPIAFTPDGKFLASADYDKGIKLWCPGKGGSSIDCALESFSWWEILGVYREAQPEEVKGAYRRKARIYHPDINKSQEAIRAMQLINLAYQRYLEEFQGLGKNI